MTNDDTRHSWLDGADESSTEDSEELSQFGELFEDDTGDLPLAARRALTGLLSKP